MSMHFIDPRKLAQLLQYRLYNQFAVVSSISGGWFKQRKLP